MEEGTNVCASVCRGDGLAVPVVDLLDVAKNDLVLPSHVFWDSSDFQPGHETLRERERDIKSTS